MAIYCDQTGYLPHSVKTAVMTEGKTFDVIRLEGASERTVLSGAVRDAGSDAASGDHVYVADFSDICEDGVYYIRSDAGAQSHRFRIGRDVYRALQADMIKALYFQRCGCELEEKYAGVYKHPCCHTGDAVLWEDRMTPATTEDISLRRRWRWRICSMPLCCFRTAFRTV